MVAWPARAVQEPDRETSFPRMTPCPNSKACSGPRSANTPLLFGVDNWVDAQWVIWLMVVLDNIDMAKQCLFSTVLPRKAHLASFACLFPTNARLHGRFVIHKPDLFVFLRSTTRWITPSRCGGWNCFHPFPETMQVIYDEGPWQVDLLIPRLAFIPNEDVAYWRTFLWNTWTGCTLATLILSKSYKPFIKNIPRAHLPHSVNLWAGSSSHPV